MPNYAHVLVGMLPTQSISDLMQDIKGNSFKWINEKKFLKIKFEWQSGYGTFSYSKSHVQNVINYINNQEIHHQKQTFGEEYLSFLQKFDVDYDERISLKIRSSLRRDSIPKGIMTFMFMVLPK